MVRVAYRVGGYFGLVSIFGALLYGFRYDAHASWLNYVFDLALYGAWAAVHLVMTRPWFKARAYGARTGSPFERQVFIVTTVITWLAVLWYHRPVPGGSIVLSGPVRFAAQVGFLACVFAFFEGATFAALDGFLGVPGAAMSHSQGTETPLLTEGRYAQIRHPQYQAAILAGLCSLLIHPNVAQVLWCLLIGGTFVAFIPVEEAQLLAARGDAYAAYVQRTPWRLIPGVW
ncbi:MAG: methyltransferase family protein [Candidatus Binatia bacterium]